ncbi:MAG: 4-hydroxy-tetrahydrodipicolinate reductase, partial [Acidobacteriota bacterium]
MKLALIGYGKMGKLIKTLAEEKGYEIAVVLDENDAGLPVGEFAEKLRGADVAIDFTNAEAVRRNVEAAMIAGVPLVEGTTGWNADRDRIEKL